MARPYVVAHLAVSLDGATTGFEVAVARYYELVPTWGEDVTLTGADTVLAQEEQLAAAAGPGPAPGAALLAVVDSRRRVTAWEALRDCGYFRDVVALRAQGDETGGWPEEIATGGDRVDLAAALRALADEHGAQVVRVDSGGALVGALLHAGLLDELSLLVHPYLAGAASDRRWHGAEPPPATRLKLLAHEQLDGGLVWLRYTVA